jgi:hypothetical protein
MSNNLNSRNIILLGAGPTAREYSEIIKHLAEDFIVIGKNCEGVKKFKKILEYQPYPAGKRKKQTNNLYCV